MFVLLCFVYVQTGVREPVIWWINVQLFQHLADASDMIFDLKIMCIGLFDLLANQNT